MAFRQVDGGAADENVFVDDRCPTIWQAPRFGSSPLEPRNCGKSAQTVQNERDATLYTNKVKTIDGGLLRKLHKATVEEKRRASLNADTVKKKQSNESHWKTNVKSVDPPGFHIPPGVGTSRPRAQELPKETAQNTSQLPSQAVKPIAKKGKSDPVTSALPIKSVRSVPANPVLSVKSVKSESGKTNLVRITGNHGEEAFVEMPVSSPSIPAVEESPAPVPSIIAAGSDIPVIAVEPSGKENKKKNRKNKKAQKREEKAKQAAGIIMDLGLANDKHAKGASNDDNALMAGALPVTSDIGSADPAPHAATSNAGFEGVIERRSSSHVVSKKEGTTLQPTVESVASRLSSRASRESKAASTRTPSVRTASTKLSSFRSFEAVGEAWIGPGGSRAGSADSSIMHSASKAPSEQDFEDLSQQWIEPDESVQVSKAPTRDILPSIHSLRSSRRSSPRVVSRSAFIEDGDEPGEAQPNVLETHSIHNSAHADSQRLSIKTAQSVRSGLVKTQSRRSSLRHSSVSKFSEHELRIGNSPDGAQLLAGERNSQWSHADSQEENLAESTYRSRAGMMSVSGSRRSNERLGVDSKHSQEIFHFSQGSQRPSRHASTRSFSPREDIWEGPPSMRGSVRSGSRLSPTQHLEPDSEHSASKHSVVKSVLGSVASLFSRVSSDLSFEQIGEGWRSGSPGDGLEHNSLHTHASNRASSQVLRSLGEGDNHGDNHGWKPVERPESEQSRSDAHSRHASCASTRRSHYVFLDSRARSSNHPSNTSRRSGSRTRERSLVGVPVHALISSTGQRAGTINAQEDDNAHSQLSEKRRKKRPTVFAGDGWITPHPLESSVVERTPVIVLPSAARADGATLSYEEWKAIQEDGMRNHRNFSITESNQSERERHKDDRYRFSGWESRSWQEVEPANRDPNAASTHRTRSRNAPTVRNIDSEPASELSALGPLQDSLQSHSRHSQRCSHRKLPLMSSSERLLERMEEGDAWDRSIREDSVLSDKDSGKAYSQWSQPQSRASRSGSRHR